MLTEPNTKESAPHEDKAFILWLQRSLRQGYDAVAAEPIPEDLLRLVEEGCCDRAQSYDTDSR